MGCREEVSSRSEKSPVLLSQWLGCGKAQAAGNCPVACPQLGVGAA